MGRLPKPDLQAGLSVYPTPTPADYCDEVLDVDYDALAKMVSTAQDGTEEDWELVDGPAW